MLLSGPRQPEIAVCVAHYEPVPDRPNLELGSDGCGNVWARVQLPDGTSKCFYEAEPGIIYEINCFAEGDTLAAVPVKPEG